MIEAELLVICLRAQTNGRPVLNARFRRRDADGGDRDGRAPKKPANNRGDWSAAYFPD
jgi:hypothetical protein